MALLAPRPTELQLGVNESYTLVVNLTHAVVTAQTEWGALHGINTFVSLVSIEPWESPVRYVLRNDVPLYIDDAPRVRWRGLMIDTARHYLSVSTIKQAIDAMAATKMNDLHWVSIYRH